MSVCNSWHEERFDLRNGHIREIARLRIVPWQEIVFEIKTWCFFVTKTKTRSTRSPPSTLSIPHSKISLVNIRSTGICTAQNISDGNSLAQLGLKFPRPRSSGAGVADFTEGNMISSLITSIPDMPPSSIDNLTDRRTLHGNPSVRSPRATEIVRTLCNRGSRFSSDGAVVEDVVTCFRGSAAGCGDVAQGSGKHADVAAGEPG